MDLIVDFPQVSRSLVSPSQSEQRVSFMDRIEVNVIENLAHKHKFDLWFTDRDIKSCKCRTSSFMRKIMAEGMTIAQYAEMNIAETSAFMGLENYLSVRATQEIRYQRKAINYAVLIEQDRQLKAGIYDPDTMADISEAASEWSRKRARIIGLLHNAEERPKRVDITNLM